MHLFERIAQKLAADIEETKLRKLPGVRALAARYDCSFNTMLKVLHVLEENGTIIMDGNRRARVAGAAPEPDAVQHATAAESLAGTITDQITKGILQAGNRLPKVDFYVVDHGVSRTTVSDAFEKLASQGLIHKQGRAWIVGAPRTERAEGPTAAVLLLLPNEHFWIDMTTDPRESSRFAIHFISEAEKQGITLIPVFMGKQSDRNLRQTSAAGMAGIRKLIRGLGHRYLGTLVPVSRSENKEIDHWLRWLLEFRQPVLWLDRADEGLGPGTNRPLMVRMYPDLAGAGRRTADLLHRSGHRVIGVPRFYHHHHMDKIITSMREHNRRHSLGLDFRVRKEVLKYMHTPPGGMSSREAFRATRKRGIPMMRRVMDRLAKFHPEYFRSGPKKDKDLWGRAWRSQKFFNHKNFILTWMTPILTPMVRDPEVTALVCPGNKYTRYYYWWMDEAGLDIPGDVSVISVDNCYDYHPFPMSSLDLGFDYIGYAAAHRFIGDVPIKVDHRGDLKGKITYHDRGSVAEPPRHIRKSDLDGELL